MGGGPAQPGDQGCLSLSQDSLQAQHLVVGSGESPPEYKELPPQSQTQRQVKGYLPTSSSWFTGETTTPEGVGTHRGHWPDGDSTGPRRPLRWRGAHLHSPGRGCFHPGGPKVVLHASALAQRAGRGGPLASSRKAGPATSGRPSAGVALSKQAPPAGRQEQPRPELAG